MQDTDLAECPDISSKAEIKFRDHLSKNWKYPANPTKLDADELLSFQRQILEEVISLDTPWMIHSNLLEKYGLPVTRALLREMLDGSQPCE